MGKRIHDCGYKMWEGSIWNGSKKTPDHIESLSFMSFGLSPLLPALLSEPGGGGGASLSPWSSPVPWFLFLDSVPCYLVPQSISVCSLSVSPRNALSVSASGRLFTAVSPAPRTVPGT